MGKELKIPNDKIQEFVEAYNEAARQVLIALNQEDITGNSDEDGNWIDARDFIDYATSFELKGKTEEERQESMNQQVREMVKLLKSNNPHDKKIVLDQFYSLLDSTDELMNKEILTVNDFKKLCSCAAINQSIATKRNENPDYYFNRYNTVEKRLEKLITTEKNFALQPMIEEFKNTKTTGFNFKPSFSYDFVKLSKSYALLCIADSKFEGNTILLTLPNNSVAEKDFDDSLTPGLESLQTIIRDMDSSTAYGKFLGLTTTEQINPYLSTQMIYIGDKNIRELAMDKIKASPDYNPNEEISDGKIARVADVIYKSALVDGKSYISIATPQYLGNDFSIQLTKLKPNVKRLKEELLLEGKDDEANQLPSQDDVDAVYENSKHLDDLIIDKTTKLFYAEKIKYYEKNPNIKSPIKIKSDKIINKAIRKFEEIDKYINEAHTYAYKDVPRTSITFDARDLNDIMRCYPPKGNTKEEKQEYYNNLYKNMVDAFISNDINRKKPFLDTMYETYAKSTNILKDGIQSSNDMILGMTAIRLTQAIETKAKENPEYFKSRIKTEYDFRLYKAEEYAHLALGREIVKIHNAHEHVGTINSPTSIFPNANPFDLDEMFQYANLIAKRQNKNIIDFKIKGSFNERTKEDEDNRFDIFFSNIIRLQSNINVINEKYEYNVLDPDVRYKQMVKLLYLNGESLETLATNKLRSTKEFKDKNKEIPYMKIAEEGIKMAKDALLNGNKVISYIEGIDVNDNKSIKVSTIKPDLSEVRSNELSKHNWFRLTFFNWGPFKINCPPEQKEIDKLYNENNYDSKIITSFESDCYNTIHKSDIEIINPAKSLNQEKFLENKIEIVEEKNINNLKPTTTQELRKGLVEENNNEINTSKAKPTTKQDQLIIDEDVIKID